MYNDKDLDIVNVLRMYADDLHSDGGFNGYARAMSLAADEIVKLREHTKAIEEDLVATIEQRDELGAEIERLRKALYYEENRFQRIGTHAPDCWKWGPQHYECALRKIKREEESND